MLKRDRKKTLICRRFDAEASLTAASLHLWIIVRNEHGLRPNGISGCGRVGVQRGTKPAKAGVFCGAGSPRLLRMGIRNDDLLRKRKPPNHLRESTKGKRGLQFAVPVPFLYHFPFSWTIVRQTSGPGILRWLYPPAGENTFLVQVFPCRPGSALPSHSM